MSLDAKKTARATSDSNQARPPAPSRTDAIGLVVTTFILGAPFVGVVVAITMLFGHGVTVVDLLLGIGFYAISGHGLTAGFHRMCTHRAFRANRATKIALVLAGSLGFEGGVLAWCGNHRRHHAYTDSAGDPHSPHLSGSSITGRLNGAIHAHVGWLFQAQRADVDRWIPDLLSDPDLVWLDRLFPVFCVISLAAPTLLGWAITGTAAGALGGLVWGGLVRIFLLQHATFAVNSACHLWGKRPFRTRLDDRARNFAPLALLSMGENWHNLHHAMPTLARHGVEHHQLDSTGRLIWLLEKAGLISEVRWPERDDLECRRNVSCAVQLDELKAQIDAIESLV